MTKIQCISLDGGTLESNEYSTPRGKVYLFQKGIPTEIKDKKDVDFFLSVGGDTPSFKKITAIGMVTDAVKTAVTGEPATPKLTEQELYALNKKEQATMIKKTAGMNTRIPLSEKLRVELLLKLQEGKPLEGQPEEDNKDNDNK